MGEAKRELLSQFLKGNITRGELHFELSKTKPLLFEVPVDGPHDKPKIDAIGFYLDDNKEKVYKPYSWFKEEAKNRDVAISILNWFGKDDLITLI